MNIKKVKLLKHYDIFTGTNNLNKDNMDDNSIYNYFLLTEL